MFHLKDHLIIALFFERQEIALLKSQQRYGKRMHKIAKNILHSDEDAEECVNEALLKAWESIPPNRPNLLGAFLVKITRNLALNKWKAKRTEKRGGAEVDLLLGELHDCIPATGGTAEAYESTLLIQAINNYLHSIEQTTRVIFILRYFHSESIPSISHRLQMSENNIKSKLFRTRKKLGAYLEKEGITL